MKLSNPRLETNRQRICEALSSLKVQSVTLDYCGRDDSGSILSIVSKPPVRLAPWHINWLVSPRCWGYEEGQVISLSLNEALKLFCEEYLDNQISNWYREDGSYGCLTLDVGSQSIQLEHHPE